MPRKNPKIDGTHKKPSKKPSKKQTNRLPSTKKKNKMDEKIEYFVGIDLHKKFMHVAILDSKGEVLDDFRLDCDFDTIRKKFSKMPRNTKYVLESSSVWYAIYRLLKDELGLDVILSHPYHTRLIAESKKKTDKIDAIILADMLRGGFIVECHVSDADVVQNRQLVRYRASLVKSRTVIRT